MLELIHFLGFETSPAKLVPPGQDMILLGIRLQTNAGGDGLCVASIDHDRLQRVRDECDTISLLPRVRTRQLEHLVGVMNFCSQVIYGAVYGG